MCSASPMDSRKEAPGIGTCDSVPVADERILQRKRAFRDPALCPYSHACSLASCPFAHGRQILPETTKLPRRIQYQRCANDDCHAVAQPGQFCCNPCEAEYSGGVRLIKQCPAHKGPCKGMAGRHCKDCPGEEGELGVSKVFLEDNQSRKQKREKQEKRERREKMRKSRSGGFHWQVELAFKDLSLIE